MSTEADSSDSAGLRRGADPQIAAAVDYSDSAFLPFPVVGIGASAGGVQAVCELLSHMPQDSGMALVVVQHLPPDHQSMLAEIFVRHTQMPVFEIEDGMKLAPNCVYVIRPAFSVTMDGGTFSLGEPVEERGHRRPIDDFFRSLARVQREKAIAIVLSGVGTNGTSGAQAVKAAGGVCIAQDPETADFSGMPRSLINSGYADHICRVAQIPEVLIRYIHHPYIDTRRGREHAQVGLAPDMESLAQVFAILRTRTGHSFNGYKKPTVLRRIQRRMGLQGVTALQSYAEYLRDNLDEARALANDLMINVTGFFRDPEAWEAFRMSAVAPLIERCPPDGSIRAWVTACASGEEAYTLGMLLMEEMDRQGKQVDIKIFATDTADQALAFARAGIYPTGIEGDLPQDRLDRFFDKEEHTYRVKKVLREAVVFTAHDVLRDPPFSRVDICTCRNLLIYLEPEVQQRVIFMLHFALREAGYLFLGSAETPGAGEKLFEPISKKWRIYQRTSASHHPFDLSGLVSATMAQPSRRDLVASMTLPAPRTPPTLAIQQALLDQMSTATVVVDRTDRIVYFIGNTTPYVSHPSGEPTRDVFDVMKPSLRAAARTALRRAAAKGEPVTIFAEVSADEPPHAVHLTAAPLLTIKPPEYFRITFERASMSSLAAIAQPASETSDSARALATILREPSESGLEDELRILRQELQSTVEAFEASNEELKASHEEVVSINEELQSANEELETGKEELQSLNEELITVNAQLQAKITELEATTNDLSNLLSSTNIAVVFLDTQFRVRRFTPAVYDLLELIPGDIGRPIDNLAQKFAGGGLLEDARAVLARLIPLETEVLSNSGSWYLRRTLPYRTADNHIDGVVITFVDITARRRAEQALESSQARLQSILEQLPIAMLMVDATDGALLHANRPAAQMLNLPYPVPTIGSDWKLAAASFQGTHSDGRPYRPQDWPLTQALTRGTTVAPQEIEFRNADGAHGCLSMSATPILDADGKMVVAVATMFDITEQRRGAERLRESEQRLQLLIDSALDYAIFMMDLDNRIISWNRGAERLLGWSEEEAIGRSAELIFTPEDRDASVPDREVETARREGRAVDERVHQRKNGERFWASGMLMSVYDDKGTLCRFAKIIRDETERKRAEEDLQRALDEAERVRASAEGANRAKDEFISTISHELRTPLNTIRLWARMLGSERLAEQDRIEGVRMIDRSAEAQQHLIDDLLDVSRMSSGQLRLNLRLTRLADVVRSAVESVRPSADARKVQIVVDLSEDVGVVRADPERMQQVLLNLISNAVKFTPGGGRIDVQMSRSDDDVIIVVKDTGIGIRPEFLPHVFERFRQAEIVTTRQHSGLGLGLAIAKQLVELHGGSIVASSEGAGKGATFTATLPLPRSHTEQRDSPTDVRTLVAGMNGMRVLLVEDDAGSRLATCRALELSGATMDAVPNASLAMSAYTQTRPDAMILDIGLPVEDGYSLIARIRELETAQRLSRVPAIALTAFARSDDRERAFAAGFDEHLAKPVDIETIVATLLRLTRRDRS